MPPKKGEFPERPPTLAEALYSGKEIGTRPENHEQILKDLNLPSLKDVEKQKKAVETGKTGKTSKTVKKIEKTDTEKEELKSVGQINDHIGEPLPDELPATIEANFVSPNECQAVTNLQIDYVRLRKAALIKYILNSRVFSALIFGVFSIIAYYKIGGYLNEYTFKDGILSAIKILYNNSYFLNDLFVLMFLICLALTAFFTILRLLSHFLQEEADNVPKNFKKYFNIDLNNYSRIQIDDPFNNKKLKKLNSKDFELIKFMKDYSFCIVYRETPVAFLTIKPHDLGDNNYDLEIIGYGIRRVYIKAELFKDLLQMMFKKYILQNEKQIKINSIYLNIYSFEKFDIDILRKAGFYRYKKDTINFILTNFFGITKDKYVFETESVEF